jgi:hypothetical protein
MLTLSGAGQGVGGNPTIRIIDMDAGTGSDTYLDLFQGDNSYLIGTDKLILGAGGINDGSNGINIIEDGNVGIGTIAPAVKLAIVGDNALRTVLQIKEEGDGDPSIWFTLDDSVGTPFAMGVDNSNSDSFVIASSYDLNSSPRLTITRPGNVGIGHTSPAQSLTVVGSVSADSFKFPDGTEQITAATTGTDRVICWVHFTGTTTGTITPNAHYNVSSVVRTGTGRYTINIATDAADANYVVAGMAMWAGDVYSPTDSDNVYLYGPASQAAGSFKVAMVDGGNQYELDSSVTTVMAVGNTG